MIREREILNHEIIFKVQLLESILELPTIVIICRSPTRIDVKKMDVTLKEFLELYSELIFRW
jgi:hypothetical protein